MTRHGVATRVDLERVGDNRAAGTRPARAASCGNTAHRLGHRSFARSSCVIALAPVQGISSARTDWPTRIRCCPTGRPRVLAHAPMLRIPVFQIMPLRVDLRPRAGARYRVLMRILLAGIALSLVPRAAVSAGATSARPVPCSSLTATATTTGA